MGSRTLLLVDDEDDIRTVGRISLERVGGYAVIVAASGPAALSAARERQPDLILLDVMMPGMDGPAVLAELRREPATARIPVIFLTAKTQAREVEQYLALGATGVIAKPFDPLTLAHQVDRILADVEASRSV